MVACSMEAKLCSDGVTYVSRTWANCEFEKCPDVKACTMEYAPVCGQPKMPVCTTGIACPMVMPLPKTYWNKCSLAAEWATYLYDGECKPIVDSCPVEDALPFKEGCKNVAITKANGCKGWKQVCEEKKVCTQEYAPVCGRAKSKEVCTDNGCSISIAPEKTYTNKCALTNDNAELLYEGECQGDLRVVCPVEDAMPPKEGCKNVPITKSNGCKGWKQVCEQTPICPLYDPMPPKEGCKNIPVITSAGCKTWKQVCEQTPVCPVEDALPFKEGCKNVPITKSNGCKGWKQVCEEKKVCTQEYAPVCGRPQAKEVCTSDGICTKKVLPAKTYSNKCALTNDGAEFLYTGECKKENTCPTYTKTTPIKAGCSVVYETDTNGCKIQKITCEERKACTEEYAPVCGQPKMPVCTAGIACPAVMPLPKTYWNKCSLATEWATYLYDGECTGWMTVCPDYSNVKLVSSMDNCPLTWYTDSSGCKAYKYECSQTNNGNSDSWVAQKLKNALKKLYNKLDSSWKTSTEKIAYLEDIYGKLKVLLQNNPKSAQTIQIALNDISQKIADYKSAESDSSLNDIFNIIQ